MCKNLARFNENPKSKHLSFSGYIPVYIYEFCVVWGNMGQDMLFGWLEPWAHNYEIC